MIITCPNCLSRFVVNAQSVGFAGRMVRCAKCKHSWFQDMPAETMAAEEKIAQQNQENTLSTQVSADVKVPAIIKKNRAPLYLKFAFALASIIFLFTLSIVNSKKILPYMNWYYSTIGIYDDAGISLADVSIEKVGEGAEKELLLKGRIVNNSKVAKAIPDLRMQLIGASGRILRTVTLRSHEAALDAGEGIGFENSIASPPDAAVVVLMDIGNIVNLAAR